MGDANIVSSTKQPEAEEKEGRKEKIKGNKMKDLLSTDHNMAINCADTFLKHMYMNKCDFESNDIIKISKKTLWCSCNV
jgi:hypothetical protein